jgi:CheY-like chemotaxis protein
MMDENLLQGQTILVVDDEADLRDIVASELEFMGAQVVQAENVAAAKEVLGARKIDLIVSDIRMPGGTGVDLLDHVKARDSQYPPVMLITGFADITCEQALDKGAEALMNKPFQLDDLVSVAARYTGRFEDRFKAPTEEPRKKLSLNFEKALQDCDEVELGRGGISLCLDGKGRKFENGESLNFELTFADQVLSGTGVIRWVKHPEHSESLLCIGLEFMQLSSESLGYFTSFVRATSPVAFIPSIT